MTGPRRREVLQALGALVLGGWLLSGALTAVAAEPPSKVLFREKMPRDGNPITTRVMVGDRECLMAVDTGASDMLLDTSLRGLLHREAREVDVTRFEGSEKMQVSDGLTIKAQGLSRQDLVVGIFDLGETSRGMGRTLEGLIGMSLLRAGRVMLDFEADVMEVSTGPWRLKAAESQMFELAREVEVPAFQAKLNGHDFRCVVDTGYSGCIALPAAVYDALVAKGWIEMAKSHWSDDKPDASSGWFLQGEFLGKSLVGVSVSRKKGDGGVLGLQWLCGFRTEIDLDARAMRMQVLPKALPPVRIALTIGVGFIFEKGEVRVDALYSGGEAEAMGLAVGDAVMQFAELKADRMDFTALAAVVRAHEGKTIPLRFRRKSDGALAEGNLRVRPLANAWNFAGRQKGAGKAP